MKRLVSLLLVCVLVAGILPFSAFATAKTDFEAFDLVYTQHGNGSGNFRFIMKYTDIPFEVTADNLVNLKIKGDFVTDEGTVPFTSYIKEVELREKSFIMAVPGVGDVSAKVYKDTSANAPKHEFKVKVYPEVITEKEIEELMAIETTEKTAEVKEEPKETPKEEKTEVVSSDTKTDFEAFDLVYAQHGSNGGNFRFIMKYTDIPFEVTATNMVNLKIEGEFETESGKIPFSSYIKEVELREKNFIMVVPETETVKAKEYADTSEKYPVHKFLVKVYPADSDKDESKTEVVEEKRPDSEIAVKFNGKYMEFDVDPVIINGRTMVPLRAIFEKLGCTIEWNGETSTVTAGKDGKIVVVTVGSSSAVVAGETTALDQPAVIVDSRTLVPLRFVSEAYGCKVTWEAETKTVLIEAE